MFEWKLLYGLPSELMMSVNLWNSKYPHIINSSVACLYTRVQYFSSPIFMTVNILVNKLDNCFVLHLLEQAIKRCFTGDLAIPCRHQTAQYQGNS